MYNNVYFVYVYWSPINVDRKVPWVSMVHQATGLCRKCRRCRSAPFVALAFDHFFCTIYMQKPAKACSILRSSEVSGHLFPIFCEKMGLRALYETSRTFHCWVLLVIEICVKLLQICSQHTASLHWAFPYRRILVIFLGLRDLPVELKKDLPNKA